MQTIKRNQNKSGNVERVDTKVLFSTANDTDTVDMGVAEGAMSLILEMLSDISADRGGYVLREAYSNAYDAVKAGGDMTRRIDITIPNTLAAFGEDTIAGKILRSRDDSVNVSNVAVVSVKDEGIGMTADDVRNFFLQYGGSKKRDVQTAIGSKGLGSKAPFAVTDTFELTTVHDGIETRALIHRNGDKNTADITVSKTDAANGTEVVIPVTDYAILSQMRDCAKLLGDYNTDANLYINGEKAVSMFEKGEILKYGTLTVGASDEGDVEFDAFVHPYQVGNLNNKSVDNDFDVTIVIGGYPYSLCGRSKENVRWRYNATAEYVIFGEPGYLNFTPSRDEIKNDQASEDLYVGIVAGIVNHGSEEIIKNFIGYCNDNNDLNGLVNFLRRNVVSYNSKDDTLSLASRASWDAVIDRADAQYHGHDILEYALANLSSYKGFSDIIDNGRDGIGALLSLRYDTKSKVAYGYESFDINDTVNRLCYGKVRDLAITCFERNLSNGNKSRLNAIFQPHNKGANIVLVEVDDLSDTVAITKVCRNLKTANTFVNNMAEPQRGDEFYYFFTAKGCNKMADIEKELFEAAGYTICCIDLAQLADGIAIVRSERAKSRKTVSVTFSARKADFKSEFGLDNIIENLEGALGEFTSITDISDEDIKDYYFAVTTSCYGYNNTITRALANTAFLYARKEAENGRTTKGIIHIFGAKKNDILTLENSGARFIYANLAANRYAPTLHADFTVVSTKDTFTDEEAAKYGAFLNKNDLFTAIRGIEEFVGIIDEDTAVKTSIDNVRAAYEKILTLGFSDAALPTLNMEDDERINSYGKDIDLILRTIRAIRKSGITEVVKLNAIAGFTKYHEDNHGIVNGIRKMLRDIIASEVPEAIAAAD